MTDKPRILRTRYIALTAVAYLLAPAIGAAVLAGAGAVPAASATPSIATTEPCPPTVSAMVSGAGVAPIPRPGSLANGDFFVTAASRGPLVGDGADERTIWVFDFRADEDYRVFRSLRPELESALLTITLTGGSAGMPNDRVRIVELGRDGLMTSDALMTTEVGETKTLEFELLDWTTSDELLYQLLYRGVLHGSYADDAFVSSARLDLIPQCGS